ncbi:MAG: hypothetical protein CR217_18130 [Beijerinckiaceae bacterium]|nr:MAG: hypothetical protein CR217_18130 [Beijerinckiaceae bacterium]
MGLSVVISETWYYGLLFAGALAAILFAQAVRVTRSRDSFTMPAAMSRKTLVACKIHRQEKFSARLLVPAYAG